MAAFTICSDFEAKENKACHSFHCFPIYLPWSDGTVCHTYLKPKCFIRPKVGNGEGNGTPLQYSCLENPMDGGAGKPTVHGVAKSRTWLSNFTFTFHFHALEKEMATHSSVLGLENPRDGRAWWAAVYGVAQSRTWLKWLSNSKRLVKKCLIEY